MKSDVHTRRKRWSLLLALANHDIGRKYKETIFGSLWSIVTPLVLLGVYTLIFSEIFHAKWKGIAVSGRTDYAVLLFIGLIVFQIFAEAVNRAPSIIAQNSNFVKKVVFPLEILPVVPAITSLYAAGTSLISLAVFFLLSSFKIHAGLLLFPLLLIPVVILTVGVCYWVASLGVYLKDMDQFTTLFTRVLQYVSPVLYPTLAFPESIGSIMRLNPLAVQIEDIRNLLVAGQMPAPAPFLYSLAASILIFVTGYAWFKRTRQGFADVL